MKVGWCKQIFIDKEQNNYYKYVQVFLFNYNQKFVSICLYFWHTYITMILDNYWYLQTKHKTTVLLDYHFHCGL